MGDRTSVRLLLLTEQVAFAQSVVDLDAEGTNEWSHTGIHSECLFEEVNYGRLHFLSALTEAGIAFNSVWSDGGNYSSGITYGRFLPDGTSFSQDIYDDEINLDLAALQGLFDKPNALVLYIQEQIKNTIPIPWDNQIEYGKLYRARKLITPN